MRRGLICQQVPTLRHKLPPPDKINDENNADRKERRRPGKPRFVGRVRTTAPTSSPHYSGRIVKEELKVNIARPATAFVNTPAGHSKERAVTRALRNLYAV